MKKLIGLVALLFAVSVSAATTDSYIDLGKLTDEQKAELKIKALQMEQEAKKASVPTVDTATKVRTETEKWAELGTNVSSAVIAGAKNLGMAANEFAQTPLGMVTTGIIVYKVVGKDVLRFFAGLLLAVVGTVVGFKWFRFATRSRYEYENIPRLGGLWVSSKLKSCTNDDSNMGEAWFGMMIPTALGWAIGIIVMFL